MGWFGGVVLRSRASSPSTGQPFWIVKMSGSFMAVPLPSFHVVSLQRLWYNLTKGGTKGGGAPPYSGQTYNYRQVKRVSLIVVAALAFFLLDVALQHNGGPHKFWRRGGGAGAGGDSGSLDAQSQASPKSLKRGAASLTPSGGSSSGKKAKKKNAAAQPIDHDATIRAQVDARQQQTNEDVPEDGGEETKPTQQDLTKKAEASADIRIGSVTPEATRLPENTAPYVPPGRSSLAAQSAQAAAVPLTESYLGAYSVPNHVSAIKISILSYHRRASIKLTYASADATELFPDQVAVSVGPTQLRISVTSADGSTTRHYALTVWRMVEVGSPFTEIIRNLQNPMNPPQCTRTTGCGDQKRCVFGRCVCPPLHAAYRSALPPAAARNDATCYAAGANISPNTWCLPPMRFLRVSEIFDSRGAEMVLSDTLYSREVRVTSRPVTLDAFTVSKAAGGSLELLRAKQGRDIHDHDLTGLRHLGVSFDTCAVVLSGSEGSQRPGALIDAHDAVLRIGNARAKDDSTGRRTTIRWQMETNAEGNTARGYSEGRGDLPEGREICVVPIGSFDHRLSSRFTGHAECEYREVSPAVSEYLAGLWAARRPPNARPKERQMGSAFSLIAFATQLCGQVTVFGKPPRGMSVSSVENACMDDLRSHRVFTNILY